MLRNYLKTALRNFSKNPVFSIINITGLSLGITAFLLILQYVGFERSVNSFHKNLHSLHRILFEGKDGYVYDYSAPIIGPIVKQNFGETTSYCRVVSQSFVNGVASSQEGGNEKLFSETKVAYADGNFFELFTFPVSSGSAEQLKEPNTMALSVSTARKYFNGQSALGKIVSLNNEFGDNLYKVVAVFDDFPQNSDMQYDMVLSLQTLANPSITKNSEWSSLEGTSSYLTTYLQIVETANVPELENKMNELKKKLDPSGEDKIMLQPMKNMHLAASLDDRQLHSGNIGFVYLFAGIGILILVIAWFNYVNLSTASALKRAKEVGLRKVVGASKMQLIAQFLGESFLLNAVSLLLALGLVNIFQFFFNQLMNKNLSLGMLASSSVLLWGLALMAVGTVASGAYTAFVLSSFQPASILKGVFGKSSTGLALRKTLVVFQFSVSVLLIAATLIMNKQLKFMRTENLGMDINQLMVMTHSRVGIDSTYKFRRESFKNVLAQKQFVEAYCGSANVPSNGYNYSTNGITRLNPQAGDEKKGYSILYVDELFFFTYGIGLAAGSFFSLEDCNKPSDNIEKVIINERAAAQLGFANAEEVVGKKIKWNDAEAEVHGVVKDYHHQSLKDAIEPAVYVPKSSGSYFTVRLNTQNLPAAIADLKASFHEYFPGNPFDYFFVDDNFNRQYQTEEQNQKLFITASCLAIFIACLGLFGLAAFTVDQRTKEIGIRKVMGANRTQLTTLLSRDFLLLTVIAVALATPLAWWAMNQWLQQFAYRTEVTIWVFALAGSISVLIALLTIGTQTLGAANANPVKSLRSE